MNSYLYALISTFVPEHSKVLTELADGLLIKEIKDGKTYANGVLHSFDEEPAVIWNGIKEWYLFGQLHRDKDLPAVIYPNGTRIWYQQGKIHRDNDLPAVISYDDYKQWFYNGKIYRESVEPAINFYNSLYGYRNGPLECYKYDNFPNLSRCCYQAWYQKGQKHRDNDLPAVIYTDGSQEWWQNGKRHRDSTGAGVDLPAVICNNRSKQWYQNGLLHRDNDLPAVILDSGLQMWYQHGKLNRNVSRISGGIQNGPAIIYSDGRQEWYRNDEMI